nr:unnamed protein product [Digitaria exilis]
MAAAAAAALRCCFPGSAIVVASSAPTRGGADAQRPWELRPLRWGTVPASTSPSSTRSLRPPIFVSFVSKLTGVFGVFPYPLCLHNTFFDTLCFNGISAKATDAYEGARRKVANFVNAADSREIVFTRNATEAINLVAYSWGLSNIKQGDEILLTVAEHHSAIVPWQFVSQKTGATLKYVGLTKEEVPDIEQLKGLLSNKTKMVVIHHVSNVLGSMLPIEEIVTWSKRVGAKVLVDACQSVPHMPVDVQKLGADFLVASSHKMCGPTGVGFMHSTFEMLSTMEPFLGGGEMIADVFNDKSTYAEPPSRLLSVPNVRIYGPAPSQTDHRAPLCSFNVDNVHATDIAEILDLQHSVAIRSGHHCAQILHRNLGINASARASLYFYNTKEEVDVFIHALKDTIDFLTSQH